MPNESEYSIGELAAMAGVTPRTIRYYVSIGLLASPGQAGPQTRYGDSHLARLRLIRKLQREHLPLGEIAQRLDGLDEEAVEQALEAGEADDAPGSALDYIRQLQSETAAPQMELRRLMPSGPVMNRSAVTVSAMSGPAPKASATEQTPAHAVGARAVEPERRTAHPPAGRSARTETGRAAHPHRPRDPRGRRPAMTQVTTGLTPEAPRSSSVRTARSSDRAGTASASWSRGSPRRRPIGAVSRPSVNLAFVLDRSGSMDGQKIRLAAQAIEEAINRLQPSDRFAVVIYDDVVETIVPGTLATPAARSEAIGRLRSIGARNMTNLSGGWLAGCEQVASALDQEGVNRALLLTDGLANVGITDRDELARHAGELRARGVSTSTFGVGDDFDEVLLAGMATAGGGHFYFIASAAQIRDHIGSEVGETLEVVARDVTLDVTLPDGVRLESLGAFPAMARGGRTSIELGDLVSGQEVEVPMRLFFGFGQVGDVLPAVMSLSDRDGVLDGAAARLAWSYADDRANDAQPRDRHGRPDRGRDLRGAGPPAGGRAQSARGVRGGVRGAEGDGPQDPRLRRWRCGARGHRRRAAARVRDVRPGHG